MPGHGSIQKVGRSVERGRDVLLDTGGIAIGPITLLEYVNVCKTQNGPEVSTLLILPGADDVRAIQDAANDSHGSDDVVHLGPADARSEAKSLTEPDIVVTTPERLIDHIRRGNIDLTDVRACLVSPPEGDHLAKFAADLHFIYTKFDQPPATVLFSAAGGEIEGLSEILRRPVWVSLVDGSPNLTPEPREDEIPMSESDLPFDPESTAQKLRDIVKQIHHDEDPREMNQYRRFIRRHVSVFNRGYFTAYLFKKLISGGELESTSRKSMFVSAGRNRRVHARDLVTLFTSADGVDRDDIGQIKVLDNYSFVEVESSKAQQAIDALNGTDFRGRKLTVNFARRK